MAVSRPPCEDAAAAGAEEKRAERDQRRDDWEPAAAGDAKAEEDDVPGHVRREHVAEPEVADGIDETGGEGEDE
jgi:hypothetical protein